VRSFQAVFHICQNTEQRLTFIKSATPDFFPEVGKLGGLETEVSQRSPSGGLGDEAPVEVWGTKPPETDDMF